MRVLRSGHHKYSSEHTKFLSYALKESSRQGLSNDMQLKHSASADEVLSIPMLESVRLKVPLGPLLEVCFSLPPSKV